MPALAPDPPDSIAAPAPSGSVPTKAALMLGIALAGFFDGILLHQVLEWHHLLSDVDGSVDLRTQLLADGLFHLLMYLLMLIALVRLGVAWRSLEGAGCILGGRVLVGFALWQAIDVVGFHWIAGIHRVRGDVANPLAWDIGWLLAFGLPPLLAARWLHARRPAGGRGTASGLAVLVVSAGAWSAWPALQGSADAVVAFAPGVTPAAAFDALARQDARVRWVDANGGVWAVQWNRPPSATRLLSDGAVLVGGTPLGLGCVGWTQPPGV